MGHRQSVAFPANGNAIVAFNGGARVVQGPLAPIRTPPLAEGCVDRLLSLVLLHIVLPSWPFLLYFFFPFPALSWCARCAFFETPLRSRHSSYCQPDPGKRGPALPAPEPQNSPPPKFQPVLVSSTVSTARTARIPRRNLQPKGIHWSSQA